MMLLPFSEKARQMAQTQEFTLDKKVIVDSKVFIAALLSKQLPETITGNVQAVRQLAVCKVILSICPYQLIFRFANAYSSLWQKFFRDNKTSAMEFAKELFPSISLNDATRIYSIPVFEFLEVEESISLQRVEKGVVLLFSDELNEVLGRQVRRKVLTVPQSSIIPVEVKAVAAQLSKEFALSLPKSAKNLERLEIKQIRMGQPEGGRFYGCMKLSRACFRDNLSFEEAKQVIFEYVKSCPQGKSPFSEKEALTTLEWVYRKGQQRSGINGGALQ
ncbi:MAG: hypothetical protein V1722_05595 [Candidatus Micrarchaeota archaeon]